MHIKLQIWQTPIVIEFHAASLYKVDEDYIRQVCTSIIMSSL